MAVLTVWLSVSMMSVCSVAVWLLRGSCWCSNWRLYCLVSSDRIYLIFDFHFSYENFYVRTSRL